MVGSGDNARPSIGELVRVGFDGSAGGGLEFLGATDSRRGREDVAVIVGWAGTGSGGDVVTMGDDVLGPSGDG
jgi:hypothetical protein